jgi:hypothetical protein
VKGYISELEFRQRELAALERKQKLNSRTSSSQHVTTS